MHVDAIQRIAVVGTGAMGSGIALNFALYGYPVDFVGRSAASIERGFDAMRKALQVMQEHDLVTPADAHAALDRIAPTTDRAAAVGRAQFVMEAVVEDLALKQAVFREVDAVAPPETILASTTSSLSPTAIARDMARPERFVVAHYAQPAQLMVLVEVVPGQRTAPATVETTCALLRRVGRMPVVCQDIPGFLFSRLQSAILRECVALVRRGAASPEDIDTVLKYGYAHRLPAMGPFEHADLGGLDLIHAVAAYVWPDLDCSKDPSEGPIGELIQQGKLGMKTGQGFLDWTTRTPDEFRRQRDEEIIRRLKILRGGKVVLPQEPEGSNRS
uniref:L-gulonate 3-dehydrogenase n=1 Tax=Thermorudis sp. TaxID=1969470 RepID=A0A7C3ALS7_9BACT